MRSLLCLAIVGTCLAVIGVDLSSSSNSFQCMRNNGMEFVITRGFYSYGAVDPYGVQNLINAKAAGLYADAYFFPCRGKNADDQVAAFVSYYDARGLESIDEEFLPKMGENSAPGMQAGLKNDEMMVQEKERFLQESVQDNIQSNIDGSYQPQETLGQLYGTVWIDVEMNPSTNCGWEGYSTAQNCVFLGQIVNGFRSRGKLVGIYSSRYQWGTIFGRPQDCNNFTDLPVWYAHYDEVANFNDWSVSTFGGWSYPSIKQYQGDVSYCSTGVDMNFY